MKNRLFLLLLVGTLLCGACSKDTLTNDINGTNWYGKSSIQHGNLSYTINMDLCFTSNNECTFQIGELPVCNGTYTYAKKEGSVHFSSVTLPFKNLKTGEKIEIEFTPLDAPFTYDSKNKTITLKFTKGDLNISLTMKQV